ncbi:MAG: type II toxin-antitoxin system RelB/DinJ family antitoxin [Synergistaceae bacterium]|nr:type II toxin-antitoxin system RelB/DinJ family antitoxin [Synergistaceae bacterium]
MSEEAVMQVRIDADLKMQAENLYRKMGISFAEAVRLFAKQSVIENAMPFVVSVPKRNVILGVANGKYVIPDDIDKHNNEIASMFGVENEYFA